MSWGSEAKMERFLQAIVEHLDLILFVALLAGPILVWQQKEFSRGS